MSELYLIYFGDSFQNYVDKQFKFVAQFKPTLDLLSMAIGPALCWVVFILLLLSSDK